MVKLVSTVFRDYATNQVPPSGPHRPHKREIREWGTYLESVVSGAQVGGAVVFSTKAQADATLTYGPYQMAWVVGDTTSSNNGIYQKSGSSGLGFWSKKADLPYSFYRAHNVGAGSANAIQATTDNPIANTESLIVVNITTDNTASPVTLSLNGGSPLTIKTASGNDPVVGGLVTNMLVAGYIDSGGTQFRMLSDQASAAIQVAIEAAQAAAELARDLAVDAADQAAIEGAGDVPTYPTRALAIAATIPAARTYIYLSAYAAQGDGGFAQ